MVANEPFLSTARWPHALRERVEYPLVLTPVDFASPEDVAAALGFSSWCGSGSGAWLMRRSALRLLVDSRPFL